MVVAILLFIATILCILAIFREAKQRNFFAVGFAGISTLVFGWFSVMSIIHELFPK
ncbi:DUF2759 domain-containing protein [Salirhabdus sp. Marseille-P4669]|uniref:DUF2759 domain-containing protein n=1 Tax=Salirhabdus sp. Marseille-P4669 TaxID=2042310 RepID=UPI000C7DAD20|nr:DUF2759 domain-containing protein [Salirhabdus sp. Marseille-P4669]